MLETIGRFLGNIALYVAVLLALVALYFLWIAFREWRSSTRAAFGIERDIAISEMMGAVARAGIVIVVGAVVLVLGQVGQRIGEPSDDTSAEATQTVPSALPEQGTATPGTGEGVPTLAPTDTLPPELTDIPPLPVEPTETPVFEPTPQTARVTPFGGVWLRDAPNGGTIAVLPQGSIVQFLEGREFAGDFEWQRVRVLNTPAEVASLVDQEGWVAAEFVEVNP